MRLFSACVILGGCGAASMCLADPAETMRDDPRLSQQRTLRDAYHPWVPPKTRSDWERRAQLLRHRMLVSTGLWPMPPSTPITPVIHGRIDRGDYTVEKVMFASHPGHYVTGNLYRPRGKPGQRRPGVLSPHGHWAQGRFYDAGADTAQAQLARGAEQTMAGARFPLQARMVQMARMGCVVFHYDMVGYADSQVLDHRRAFTDPVSGLWLQNSMGLQTFNSLRALDFLTSLPDVDPERIGVTGASGGGTQTFMLCAIDPRPTVAFPAVMVSTGMQGGCVCENADYLRIGINNIAIAALCAPRPMALSGADDWTIEIESKGLPELKAVYALYGKADLVRAKALPQFKHNYNRHSRRMMYAWFNTHLGLDQPLPIVEQDFWPVLPAELSVFDAEHSLPADARDATQLKSYLTEVSQSQFQRLVPRRAEDLAEFRRVIGTAARVLLDSGLPDAEGLQMTEQETLLENGIRQIDGVIRRRATGERVPYRVLSKAARPGQVVLWFDPQGKSHMFQKKQVETAVGQLLDRGFAVVSADLLRTGDPSPTGALPEVNSTYQGYTFGYNRPLLSNRVRDILTVIGAAVHVKGHSKVHLLGTGTAGPWTLLAAGVAGDAIGSVVIDANRFDFGQVQRTNDPMYLPGAMKYGGLGGLAALVAPRPMTVTGILAESQSTLIQVYRIAGGQLKIQPDSQSRKQLVESLLKSAGD
ncbi:MAG: hypothetical protein ABGZ17_29750 [Planctomycetaceae bacterium]